MKDHFLGYWKTTLTPKLTPLLTALLVPGVLACTATPRLSCTAWNSSPFFEEASVGDVDRCLSESADPNARDKDGLTSLHAVAKASETPAVVQVLLDAGADINVRDKRGHTPLHTAAALSRIPAVVQVLLDAGADLNAQSENGWTPLHWAAAQSAAPAVVQALFNAGADLNALNRDRKTALQIIPGDSPLRGTDVFWQLNEARFQEQMMHLLHALPPKL